MISVAEAAPLLGIKVRRVQELCKQGRIKGAYLDGIPPRTTWQLPNRPKITPARYGPPLRAMLGTV